MQVDTYLEMLETGYYEVTFAFDGLADAHVWKRPAEGILSIGELAGHIAYWEALRLASEGATPGEADLSKCRVSSPLIDSRFDYYPRTIATVPTDEQRAMTAEQVCQDLLRIHRESIAFFKALNPDLESIAPGNPSNFTYAEYLKYAPFHIAYHIGQMYTVRHLLGETTPDN